MSAPDLTDLLRRRAWVTITNPVVGGSWSGHVIAHHDDPGVVIEQADGMRLCLPQSFTITEEDEPPQTLAEASEAMLPPPSALLAPGGRFEDIAFFGHLDHTGYVTEAIDHGGNAVYRIDLPEKIWGGNPLAEIEYAASAKFSRKPVTEESVRAQWEAERARAERWRQQQAEWDQAGSQRALPAVDMSASLTGERPCLCGPDEQCDECVPF